MTGKEKWRFTTGDAVSSSPLVSNGIVYVGSRDNNLYAIDTVTGKEKWRFTLGSYNMSASPVVSNGVVYIGSDDNNLYAIDTVTGTEKWRFTTGGDVASPAVSNGIVYVGSQDNILYAIDTMTGTEKWLFRIRTTGTLFIIIPSSFERHCLFWRCELPPICDRCGDRNGEMAVQYRL